MVSSFMVKQPVGLWIGANVVIRTVAWVSQLQNGIGHRRDIRMVAVATEKKRRAHNATAATIRGQ